MSITKDINWNRFFAQVQKDLKLWFFFILVFALFRGILIIIFRDKIDAESDLLDVLAVLANGFRYDCRIAAYFLLVPILGSAACGFFDLNVLADRVRSVFGLLFIILTTVLFVVTIGYFKEYDDQFNVFALELFYDDAAAIFSTIWTDYHPILNLCLMTVLAGLAYFPLRWFLRGSLWPPESLRLPRYGKVILTLLIGAAFFFGSRGSLGRWSAKRMNAAATEDEFLNKMVFNSYTALRYAIQDHLRLSSTEGAKLRLSPGEVREAARLFFHTDRDLDNLDDYLLREASGPKNPPPRHIFLIISESYDSWSVLPEYEALGLKTQLKRLTAQGGLYLHSFLPSSIRTMASLCCILTGFTDPGVMIESQSSAQRPFPTSLPETFNRLGYRTRCFYSGYLAWHRIGAFTKAQGFAEVHGASHIGGNWLSKNAWGVNDEALYDYVLNKAPYDQPSFNLILTTSAHPPYDIDLKKEGFPLSAMPEAVAPFYDGSVDLLVFGHMWYGDKCLGHFISEAETKLQGTLFAVTGDHYSRRFLNVKPGLFERSAVPFLLYGKEVLEGVRFPEGAAGSHIDIGPTLLELAAPKGFQYHALGRNLLAATDQPFVGIGRDRAIGPDFIADVERKPKVYPLPGGQLPEPVPDAAMLKQLHDAAKQISWWRIMRGSRLTEKR